MQIKPASAEGFVKAPPPRLRLALVYGPDEGLSSSRATALVKSAVPDLADPFRIANLTAAELRATPARLGDEAAAIAMLGGRRAVRVTGADHTLARTVALFLDSLPGDALVVIEAGDIGKGALVKAVEDAGEEAAAIACYPDEGRSLETVITAALKAEGLSVAPDALQDLAARLGDDRRLTLSELTKLALYMGPDGARKGPVTRADVDAVLAVEQEADLSDIADACATGDIAALDSAYRRALSGGETAAGIVRLTLMHFERLHLASVLIAEGESAERALERAFPRLLWKRKPSVQRQIRLFTPSRAMAALVQLGEAEAATRDGLLPADAVTGRALLLIAADARRAAQSRA